MYVLGINGSPRIGGNSDILLDKTLEGAKSKGAKTEKIILNNLKMVFCQECEKVKDDGTCKIEDDFQKVYEAVKKADIVILVTPIFFGSLSAQTKTMIDRFQCHWRYRNILKKPPLWKKKVGIFIAVEASERDSFLENAKSIVKNFFVTTNIEYTNELFCKGVDEKGVILKKTAIIEKAFELGKNVV